MKFWKIFLNIDNSKCFEDLLICGCSYFRIMVCQKYDLGYVLVLGLFFEVFLKGIVIFFFVLRLY